MTSRPVPPTRSSLRGPLVGPTANAATPVTSASSCTASAAAAAAAPTSAGSSTCGRSTCTTSSRAPPSRRRCSCTGSPAHSRSQCPCWSTRPPHRRRCCACSPAVTRSRQGRPCRRSTAPARADTAIGAPVGATQSSSQRGTASHPTRRAGLIGAGGAGSRSGPAAPGSDSWALRRAEVAASDQHPARGRRQAPAHRPVDKPRCARSSQRSHPVQVTPQPRRRPGTGRSAQRMPLAPSQGDPMIPTTTAPRFQIENLSWLGTDSDYRPSAPAATGAGLPAATTTRSSPGPPPRSSPAPSTSAAAPPARRPAPSSAGTPPAEHPGASMDAGVEVPRSPLDAPVNRASTPKIALCRNLWIGSGVWRDRRVPAEAPAWESRRIHRILRLPSGWDLHADGVSLKAIETRLRRMVLVG